MDNYPTLNDYLELYKAAAIRDGFTVNEGFAIPLLEDMKTFLDLVYALGKR
jgi:hypothetical protein